MVDIVLFGHDPGAINVLYPVYKKLSHLDIVVKVYSFESGLKRLQNLGVPCEDIEYLLIAEEEETYSQFVQKVRPKIVLTGVGSIFNTEKYLWSACKKNNIPCYAIIDQWLNYGIRFSKYNVREIHKYHESLDVSYLPDYIFTIDELSKRNLTNLGIDSSSIIVSGSPHFDELIEYRDHKLKFEYECEAISDQKFVITFLSEPITGSYPVAEGISPYWGYDEKIVLYNLLAVIDELQKELPSRSFTLIVRPHPREDLIKYDSLIEEKAESFSFTFKLDQQTDAYATLLCSDLVIGMSSMLLLESYILGVPSISFQPGLSREDPFIFSREGITESVLSSEVLHNEILSVLAGSEVSFDAPSLVKIGGTDQIVNCLISKLKEVDSHE